MGKKTHYCGALRSATGASSLDALPVPSDMPWFFRRLVQALPEELAT